MRFAYKHQGLPWIGWYRKKWLRIIRFVFIDSDDKTKLERPLPLYPLFWKTLRMPEYNVHCEDVEASAKSVPMTKRYVNVKLPVELDETRSIRS